MIYSAICTKMFLENIQEIVNGDFRWGGHTRNKQWRDFTAFCEFFYMCVITVFPHV